MTPLKQFNCYLLRVCASLLHYTRDTCSIDVPILNRLQNSNYAQINNMPHVFGDSLFDNDINVLSLATISQM